MLDLIGWARTTSGDFTLTAVVSRFGGQYTVLAGDAWLPAPGDVFEDPNGLVDTVVGVNPLDPLEFFGVNEHVSWSTDFAIITRKASALPSSVNLLGPVTAFDDPTAGVTVLGLNAEYAIAAPFSATGRLSPTGWAYASIVEVSPATDLLEIASAMWFSPQGTKLVINVHADNRVVIKHNSGADIPQGLIFTLDGADITLGPGESAAFIRDTLGSNDRWRAERNSPTITPFSILGDACPYWNNVRLGRVMGTPPDITTLTNLADPTNANVTAGSAAKSPHLVDISGTDFADFDGVDDALETISQTALWAVGETDVAVWATGIIDVFATSVIVDLWNSIGGNTGLNLRVDASGIRARVLTSSGLKDFGVSFSDTGRHLFSAGYDGTDLKIYIDGAEVGSTPHTGTMSNACTGVTIGAETTGSNVFNGKTHEAALAVGPLSAAKRAAVDAVMMREVGL